MSEYVPDRWMVLRIHTPKEIIYKVFASWSGGYTGSDAWKLNSGIVRATWQDSFWDFDGSSGSVYRCRHGGYGTNGYGQAVLNNLLCQAKERDIQIDIMDEHTKWDTLQYDALAQWVEQGVKSV